MVCDFELDLETMPVGGPRMIALLGGTIGNFAPQQRAGSLRRINNLLDPDDRFLLGTDLVKDRATLEAAYDDSAGVTAEFNRNVLHVLNRELDADFPTEHFEHVAFFDPDGFEHVALFDAEREWIEMRLRALRTATVTIPAINLEVAFAAGEEVRTEISAKFTRARLQADYAASGLELAEWFTDDRQLFALSLASRN